MLTFGLRAVENYVILCLILVAYVYFFAYVHDNLW